MITVSLDRSEKKAAAYGTVGRNYGRNGMRISRYSAWFTSEVGLFIWRLKILPWSFPGRVSTSAWQQAWSMSCLNLCWRDMTRPKLMEPSSTKYRCSHLGFGELFGFQFAYSYLFHLFGQRSFRNYKQTTNWQTSLHHAHQIPVT